MIVVCVSVYQEVQGTRESNSQKGVESQKEDRMKVLVVEDEHRWQETLRKILEDDGYSVHIASSYAEAWRGLQQGLYHLAVINLRLSKVDQEDLDGMVLLGEVFDKGTPSIVVSAYGTVEEVRRAFKEYGVVDFFDKGRFDAEKFRQAVNEAPKLAAERRKEQKKVSKERKKELQELRERFFRGEILTFPVPEDAVNPVLREKREKYKT